MKKEEEEQKNKYPDVDLKIMLKSIGLSETIPKLKEALLTDPAIFFEIEQDKLMEALDIKTHGKKYKFKKKLEEVKKKHEEAMAKRDEEEISEVVESAFVALQKKISVKY